MSIFFISSWIERLVFSPTLRLHFQQNRFISTVCIFSCIRLKHGVWLFTRRFIPTKLVNEIVSEIRLGVCLNCRQTMLLSIDQAASRIPARRIWLYHCLTWKLFCVDVYERICRCSRRQIGRPFKCMIFPLNARRLHRHRWSLCQFYESKYGSSNAALCVAHNSELGSFIMLLGVHIIVE